MVLYPSFWFVMFLPLLKMTLFQWSPYSPSDIREELSWTESQYNYLPREILLQDTQRRDSSKKCTRKNITANLNHCMNIMGAYTIYFVPNKKCKSKSIMEHLMEKYPPRITFLFVMTHDPSSPRLTLSAAIMKGLRLGLSLEARKRLTC